MKAAPAEIPLPTQLVLMLAQAPWPACNWLTYQGPLQQFEILVNYTLIQMYHNDQPVGLFSDQLCFFILSLPK